MEKQNPFYFHYENENDTRESLSANSKEEFIKIFINFDDKNWLLTRLENRDFQKWLIDIGETELCNLIISIQNNSKILNKISAIKNQFLLIQYLQSTDIERAVEIVLKEYETLRSEILFYMQNRTQIILLGLTAIFTIGGLAIYPLNDFFTTENIEIPGVLNITLKRYIDGETINNKAIIPSIFIFIDSLL